MDDLIARLRADRDGDLHLCLSLGVAYQADMRSGLVEYGGQYLEKCRAYEDDDTARKVVAGRVGMLLRHLPVGSSVLDVGVGSGAFMRAARQAGFSVKGFDVIPEVAKRLKDDEEFSLDPSEHRALTMWDSMEHIENPALWLLPMRRAQEPNGWARGGIPGACLFISLPVFEDLSRVRESKHYRPGEHLYYWTPAGLERWMRCRGFKMLESSAHETEAGRQGIGAYAFRRDLPWDAGSGECEKLLTEDRNGSR